MIWKWAISWSDLCNNFLSTNCLQNFYDIVVASPIPVFRHCVICGMVTSIKSRKGYNIWNNSTSFDNLCNWRFHVINKALGLSNLDWYTISIIGSQNYVTRLFANQLYCQYVSLWSWIKWGYVKAKAKARVLYLIKYPRCLTCSDIRLSSPWSFIQEQHPMGYPFFFFYTSLGSPPCGVKFRALRATFRTPFRVHTNRIPKKFDEIKPNFIPNEIKS